MNYKLRDTFLEDGYYVTQNYMNNPTYYKQFGLLGHEGDDFGHSDKTKKARTPLAGTCFVFTDKNYGEACVIENYDQKCAVYLAHMQKVEVVNGQVVKAGDVIGEMDDTGNADGEHIHFNFVILDDKGSNKYKKKECNWGFLDPQYPRDNRDPEKFPGVEDYKIEWYRGDQSPVEPPKPVPEPVVEAPSNKELSEQIKRLQDSVNTLSEDRDIITDISSKLVSLTDEFQNFKKYVDTHMKDLKADIKDIPDSVDQSVKDSVETVSDAINKKDNVIVIMPDQAKSLFELLTKLWRSIWQPKNLT